MKKIKLSEIFRVEEGGLQVDKVRLLKTKLDGSITYIRPTNSIKRVISGYVPKNIINDKKPKIYYGKNLIVGTDGQGSHSHAHIYDGEFIPNPNVAVLIPIREMTENELVFYAYVITMNRVLFSYGRKPKGDRLKNLMVPIKDEIPKWINKFNNDEVEIERKYFTEIDSKIKQRTNQKSPSIKTVELGTLFTIEKSEKLSLEKQIKEKNGVRYVAKSGQNNGVVAHVQENTNQKKFLPMKLTVALVGSVLSTYLQDVPFYCADRLAILTPKIKMTEMQLLLYSYYLNANKKFYSYGRPADSTLEHIKVPDIKSLPHWLNLFD